MFELIAYGGSSVLIEVRLPGEPLDCSGNSTQKLIVKGKMADKEGRLRKGPHLSMTMAQELPSI